MFALNVVISKTTFNANIGIRSQIGNSILNINFKNNNIDLKEYKMKGG